MLGFPAVAEFAGTERPEDWGSIYLGDTFMQVRGDRAADFISGGGKADVKEMFSHMLSAVRRGDLNKLGSLTLIMREFGQEALWIGSVS